MRIIASPIYRAFPELDGFTDEQCRRYVDLARGGQRSRVMFEVARVMLSLGCVYVSYPVVLRNWSWSEADWLITLSVAMMATVFLLFMLFWRDVLLRLLVRRVLRGSARCPSCDYSAMGLVVSANYAVTCPECGKSIDITAYRDHCVAGADGALRFMPPRGLVFEENRLWAPQRRRAVFRSVRRIGLATLLAVPIVVLPVLSLALAQVWSASGDLVSLLTPKQLDAVLLPPGTPPSADSIARPLYEFARWESNVLGSEFQRASKGITPGTRWGNAGAPESIAKESVLQALESMGLHRHAGSLAWAADRIAEGVGASMLLHRYTSSANSEIRYAAAQRLWQLANAAMVVAVERRDAPAFARALEWHLAARRIFARTPPFFYNYDNHDELRPLVRVIADALRADGGEQLASALDAAIRRQSVRPSMEVMKATRIDWELGALASWFASPWVGSLGPSWSVQTSPWAMVASIHWGGFYWPQRRAILEHSGALFEELMADPSDRDQQKVSAGMAALDDAGPMNWVRVHRFTGASTSVDLRGATFERALATVVAIERFRRAEGRLPASLAELCPRYVDEVPKDPYRKGPFVYRVLPADPAAAWHPGYTLWSVGVNGSDDDGSLVSDVVFVSPPLPESPAEPSADSPVAPDATRGN
jgi:hypothetical protein